MTMFRVPRKPNVESRAALPPHGGGIRSWLFQLVPLRQGANRFLADTSRESWGATTGAKTSAHHFISASCICFCAFMSWLFMISGASGPTQVAVFVHDPRS